MIKAFSLAALFLHFVVCVMTQDIAARYEVIRPIRVTDELGNLRKVADLNYTMFFYGNGRKYLSYAIPQYFDKYPVDGVINLGTSSSGAYFTVPIFLDSVQMVDIRDLNTMEWYTKSDVAGRGNATYHVRTFELGYIRWELVQEFKEISGLRCQRARSYYAENKIAWDLWFCPDIPISFGPMNLIGLPGIFVEGTYHSFGGATFKLTEYALTKQSDLESLIPHEMKNRNFVKRGHIPTAKD